MPIDLPSIVIDILPSNIMSSTMQLSHLLAQMDTFETSYMHVVVIDISTDVLGIPNTTTTLTIYGSTSTTKITQSRPSNFFVGFLPPLATPRFNFPTLIL